MFTKTTPVLSLSTKRWDLRVKASSGVRRASMAGSSMRPAWRFCSMSAASHRSWYRRRFLKKLQQADRALPRPSGRQTISRIDAGGWQWRTKCRRAATDRIDRAEAAVALRSRRLRTQSCLTTAVQPNFLVQSVYALCIRTNKLYPRSMILSRCATAAAAPRLETESLLKMLDT